MSPVEYFSKHYRSDLRVLARSNMSLRNIRIRAMGKLFLIFLFVAAVAACGESSPPLSKQEATPSVEERSAQLQKQANSGDADAQFNLGVMYNKGEGVPEDAAKAVEWFQKAAAQGHDKAQLALGLIYEDGGEGVSKDAAKAAEWWEKAAAQEDARTQAMLGEMYYHGEGVPKNAAKAIEWYQKAAAQGYTPAQYELGRMYANGKGVPKDAVKAMEWFQKAAAQGNVKAQAFLGAIYAKGEGVPKDWVLAYAWFNLAAAQGDEGAKKLRDSITFTLSSAQRAEAERLSTNWKPGQVLQREGESVSGSGNAASGGGTLAKKGTGTAFVVSMEGHAVTNHHVVAGCKELRIQGRSELIQMITRDAVSDLALLKMPGETRAATVLTPDLASLRQGQDIVVFGFPLDSLLSSGGNITPGVVSAISGLGNNSNQIQITAPIQPGSSGSPVMDKKGHVVGVVSMKLSDLAMAKYTGSLPQNVNFAINGQTLKGFLDSNNVPYKTGGSLFAWEKSLADLGDEARKWTTVVECWK